MAGPRAMKAAFIDTSCLVAIALGEPGSRKVATRLAAYEAVFASGLLEAELKAAVRREGLPGDPLDVLPELQWVYPDRPLTPEIDHVLDAGYVKGADAWHLACALYLAPAGRGLHFETLDSRQRAVAAKLGFA
jgi:predicted nucleic acid-binding protein